MDERRCPDQILLGAEDDAYCILITLGMYLESYLEQFPHAKYLYTEKTSVNAANNIKSLYRQRLQIVVWQDPDFKDVEQEGDEGQGIGTHSHRKLPASYATNCGCNSEEVEIRGRWKNKKGGRVVFRYIDVKQLYHDAKVAAVLCAGGPVKYVLKDGITGIDDEWLFKYVIPSIRQRYRNDTRLCRVLALPLLYACLNDSIMVPEGI